MLIECRFCLEEIEVEDPNIKFQQQQQQQQQQFIETGFLTSTSDEPIKSTTTLDTSNNNEDFTNYVELTPTTLSKKQKKDVGNRLVRPCDCKGTQKHVHVKCLCEWIGKCNKWYCTICHRVYNLSPHQLHYCVMKLQRKGVLKNLPPLYSNSEFSRSSYFALLLFMGTLSMLMLPSTLPHHNKINAFTTTSTVDNSDSSSTYPPPSSIASTTTSFINLYPSSSSPSLYGRYPSVNNNNASPLMSASTTGGINPGANLNWESTSGGWTNSQISSIFSSCQKNPDASGSDKNSKFSSYFCQSTLYLPNIISNNANIASKHLNNHYIYNIQNYKYQNLHQPSPADIPPSPPPINEFPLPPLKKYVLINRGLILPMTDIRDRICRHQIHTYKDIRDG
eukprot:gene2025-2492_t